MLDPIHMPEVTRADGRAQVVIACEHASNTFPAPWGDLGLDPKARSSHIAWDPGARDVAERLSERLDAPLVAGTVSRLIYDCNRPPEAPDAIPARSERTDIPGNANLSDAQRLARTEGVYLPFHATLGKVFKARPAPVLVTVHSFTRVYLGQARDTEIGILHDADARLADAMLAAAPDGWTVARNDPYGPADGVTHTLRRHAIPGGHLNVMLEIRSDLIADTAAEAAMGDLLADWLTEALEDARCSA